MTAWSFDRAADFYDATRALPSDVHAGITAMLLTELSGRGTCLEIGVGTGRIALPLLAADVPLVGVDISPKMLRRLVDNADRRCALAVADVTALPFTAAAFGAVLASHVLHLIGDWRAAVDEAVRVLGPGAVLLVDFGGHPEAPWHRPTDAVMKAHGVARLRPGMSVPGPVEEHLRGRAVSRPLPSLTMPVHRTLAEDVADLEAQRQSWMWSASPDQITAAAAGVRRWAADNRWPLDRRVELQRVIQWWAFDITGPP